MAAHLAIYSADNIDLGGFAPELWTRIKGVLPAFLILWSLDSEVPHAPLIATLAHLRCAAEGLKVAARPTSCGTSIQGDVYVRSQL